MTRRSGLALLLPLAACFTPNPTFDLYPETDGSGGTIAGSSSEPDPTSTTTPPTTSPAGTSTTSEATSSTSDASTSEPLTSSTSTSEPVTTDTTTEPATSTTTGETDTEQAGCGFFMAPDQARYVHDADNGDQPYTDCRNPTETFYGYLDIASGDLLMGLDSQCDLIGETPKVYIGKGWPTKTVGHHDCVKTKVYWKVVDGQCQIAGLTIAPWNYFNQSEQVPIYMAELSPPTDLPLLLAPKRNHLVMCGCEDNMLPCCSPNDAGEYTLGFDDDVNVGAGVDKDIMKDQLKYHFWNIQSYVGPGCQDDPTADLHFDWFAERVG